MFLPLVDELLARFGLARVGDPVPVEGSVLNDNLRVETNAGPRLVRIHKRNRTRDRLEREHALIAWAAARGIPVNPPIANAEGRSVHAIGGRLLALFPWLDGIQLERGTIGTTGAATLAAMLGRIHRIFAAYDGPPLPAGGSGATWDTESSTQVLSRADDLIRYYPAHTEWTLAVQAGLRVQLELLESSEARPASEFAHLPTQAVHGDYHERNVLLSPNGAVLAVIDWEMPTVIPPVFELLRFLSFAGLLDPPLLEASLRAYRTEAALRPEDCAPGVEMWWQSALHETWAYRAYYIEGNRRAGGFFAESRARIARFRDQSYRAALSDSLRLLAC